MSNARALDCNGSLRAESSVRYRGIRVPDWGLRSRGLCPRKLTAFYKSEQEFFENVNRT
jgi:hypothetical protein